MNEFASLWLSVILRTTLWLTAAGMITFLALRVTRATSPTVHRVGWVLTLLVGWSFLRFYVALPWADPVAQNIKVRDAVDVAIPPADHMAAEREPDSLVELSEDRAVQSPQSPLDTVRAVRPRNAAVPQQASWPLVILSAWVLGMGALVVAWLIGYVRFIRGLPCSQAVPED